MLVGSAAAMKRARGFRKALGGGDAAGWGACGGGADCFGRDAGHACGRPRERADAGRRPWQRAGAAEIDLKTVQSNIVIFRVPGDAAEFVLALRERGVLASAIGPGAVRFVTHHDVSEEDCALAARVVKEELARSVVAA